MIITKEMREYFDRRMKKHIDYVNYFAKKVSLHFPNHDSDKFLQENLDIQTKFSWSRFINKPLSYEDTKELNKVTLIHITTQPHHPEYWIEDKSKLDKFSRFNPVMNLDCSKMSNIAIYEMCCDWCAVAKELYNSPITWADKTVNKRWMFSEFQVDMIYDVLKFLSVGEKFE